MSEFTPDTAEQFFATCAENAEAIAAALSTALDQSLSATAGEKYEFNADAPPEGWDGQGLLAVLDFGEQGAVVVLPAPSGLAPESLITPDAEGGSKLSEIAEALRSAMGADGARAESASAVIVQNVRAALAEHMMDAPTSILPISIARDESKETLSILAPISFPAAIVEAKDAGAQSGEAANGESPQATSSDAETIDEDAFARLPSYTRSLLKIGVPVVVRLASKKQTVSEILDFGPGAILKFEKRCDESLEMCVGDHKIAVGEVVKVGDKFGLRVSSIALPAERFHSAQAAMRG